MKIEDTEITAHGIDEMGRKGMMRQALDLALKAVRKGEEDGELLLVGARLAFRLGDLDQAAFLINRLLVLDPEHVGGWVLFGHIFAARNDVVRAGFGRSQAENLFPALSGMGLSDDLPSGSGAELRVGGRGSLSAEELNFETMTFAEICVEQGYYNKALKIYNELLAKEPGDVEVQSRVAELTKRLNRND